MDKENSDCTKLHNYLKKDSEDNCCSYEDSENNCCSYEGVKCDEEGYIISYKL